MKLGDYLKANGITQEDFASLLKSDQGHISDLVTGKVAPKLATVQEVSRLTKGEVSWLDWGAPDPSVNPLLDLMRKKSRKK